MINIIAKKIDSQPRWRIVVQGYVVFTLLYGLSNHLSIFKAKELFFIWGEEKTPFILWTILIYVSMFFQVTWGVLLLPKGRFGRAVSVGFFLILTHTLFFWFFPTTFPRSHEVVGPNLLVWGYEVLCQFDQPVSCFPSLHVALSLLTGLVVWGWSRSKGVFFIIWALVIAISTITTRQHYLIDVFGGVATAVIAYIVYWRGLE